MDLFVREKPIGRYGLGNTTEQDIYTFSIARLALSGEVEPFKGPLMTAQYPGTSSRLSHKFPETASSSITE